MEMVEQENQGTTSGNIQQRQLESQSSMKTIGEYIFNGKMTCFPSEENNNFKVFLHFALVALSVLNSALTQHLMYQKTQSTHLQKGIREISEENILYRIIFFGLIILKILLVMSAVMEIILKQEVLIVSTINKKCVNNYTILKQLDLSFSGIMVLVSWKENLAHLIGAGVISLFHTIYIQEYINRRDLLYASSSNQYIIFRAYLLLSYFANAVFLNFNNQSFFACYSLLTFAVVLVWYLVRGHELYIHRSSKISFHIVASLSLTLNLVFTQNWIQNRSCFSINQIASIIIYFGIFIIVIRLTVNAFFVKQVSFLYKQTKMAKKKDLQLMRLLGQSAADCDSESLIVGILHCSYNENENFWIDCLTNGKIYDSYLKEYVSFSAIYLQKESALRYYIKNIYDNQVKEDEGADELLDYCQFLVNEFNNIYYALEILTKAKRLSLNILQRIKIAKMEIFMKKQHDRLNQQLFDGKLKIEHIFEAEGCFHQIQLKLYQYIQGSLDVWSSLQLQQIQMSELRNALKREMNAIEEIDILWKVISHFFKFNKAWRFIYVHYIMFIKNQKIKQKELDFFTTPKKQGIFDEDNIYFEAQTQEDKLYDQKIMFYQDSCCIFATYQLGEIYIKDVNSRFTRMLGYTNEEIKGATLSLIMPNQIIESHSIKFKEWINTGLLSNETSYHPRFTSIITKWDEQVPAVKYYKAHYHIDRGLEFVCLLKSNKKPKNIEHDDKYLTRSLSYLKSQQLLEKSVKPLQLCEQLQDNKQVDKSLNKNIFLKQDILQPNKTISDINHFKIASRLFSLLMITAIICLALVNNSQSQKLNFYSNQFISLLSVYRFPILLNTNYMKQFLNIGNVTKANSVIASATSQFLQMSNKQITEKTIFDQKLNPPNTYYPYYNYSLTNRESLSQIDLFYSILSSVSSLNSKSINRTSYQYRLFNSYLKPSYDDMMNKTKNQLHKTFDQIFSSTIMQQVWFVTAQSIVLVLFIFILFKLIHTFIQKMRNIIFILLDFHPNHVLRTYRYWKSVNKSFRKLFLQVHQHNSSHKQLSADNDSSFISRQARMTEVHTSMNKQTKKMKEDVHRNRFEVKLRVSLVLIMLLILAVTVSIQFSLMISLQELRTFENDGFFFLKYFPVGPIVAMGCIEKHYSDQFPNEIQFNPKKYEDAVSAMFIFGHNNNYIGDIADPTSLYYTKQKNYFFGSPCQYNPSIVINAGTTVQKCLSICNGTFKQGISSYLRYGQRLGDNCINNKIILTTAQIDEFTLAGTVLSAYVLDAFATWASEFSLKVVELEDDNLRNGAIIICLILAIHFLVKEHRLIGFIRSQYELVKQIYRHFVPEFILVNEKVIRQKFIVEGIISN